MEKSIIIIGAGLTGLSTGCYGQMNGFQTSIFEMHDKAGGVCTGWKRKGFTIDGAMNWLIGSKPGSEYYKIWEELGAVQNWTIHNHDYYMVLEDQNNKRIPIPCNVDKLEQLMLEISSQDSKEIRSLCKAIRKFRKLELPAGKPQELNTWIDKIKMVKMLPLFFIMMKWGKLSVLEYAELFKSPVIRDLISMGNEESLFDMPVMTIPLLLSWLDSGEGGYVIGGALSLIGSIEKRYRDLGGTLHFKSQVDKILVENDKAVGIRLSDGSEHRADYVVSAADGHATIFDMLDSKFIDTKIKSHYDQWSLYPPLIYIGLGIDKKFDDIPPSLNGYSFNLDKPISIAGKKLDRISMLIYNYDPCLAEEGKTTVIIPINTDYGYWESLYENPEQYKTEKKQIAETLIAQLETRFPGITSQIEMKDIATPMTWVRYTGNWKGSYEGWLLTRKTFMKEMKKTLPGLSNFYMAGQWVNPGGGMPTAAISGNHTIQLICRDEKKKFVTTVP